MLALLVGGGHSVSGFGQPTFQTPGDHERFHATEAQELIDPSQIGLEAPVIDIAPDGGKGWTKFALER
jgi:hypothetical protein